MKINRSLLIILLFFSAFNLFAQTGPVDGSVASGVIVSTDNFGTEAPVSQGRFKYFNKFKDPENPVKPDASWGVNYIQDPSYASKQKGAQDSIILFQSHEGITQGSSIPPDPYIAVGPNHIIEVVNSRFRITDKKGNILKTISGDSWFNTTINNPGVFDPKVIYDHYAGRWVMVWLDTKTSSASFLFSVSDDDDPLGTWFNWDLPSNLNGNTPIGSWGDYQGVGYDSVAIYLTSNQFYFSGGFHTTKIRIVNKNNLYASTPGAVNYRDFYNINDFGLRPTRSYTHSDEYYFVDSRNNGGSVVALYKLNDPLGSATLTKVNVSCSFYTTPPDVRQLGGGSLPIDDGGTGMRNEPVYKDGIIHAVHAVRNPAHSNRSAVRYLAIDPQTNTTVVDFAMGTPEHYHNYPALAVSKDNDVIITYSRSSENEYMGAYYTILKAGETTPVGSITLQEGKGNYVKDFGSNRNRWGDYMGAWTDPADENNFWIYTEYVKSTNTWANWVGGIRTRPYDEAFVSSDKSKLEFELLEISNTSETQKVQIRNFGNPDLIISAISNDNSDFELQENLTFPITLGAYDSLNLNYQFSPSAEGEINDQITITTNDADDPQLVIELKGKGFKIHPAEGGRLYAMTSTSEAILVDVDTTDASGDKIGSSQANSPYSLTVSPSSEELITLAEESGTNSKLLRVNAKGGDSFEYLSLEKLFDAISFSSDNKLYGISDEKKLYEISLTDGSLTFVTDVNIKVSAMAINHTNGELWASVDDTDDVDRLYKIDMTNGDTVLVGRTGTSKITEALAFDHSGNLFGITVSFFSFLQSIDVNSGEATEIGKITGFSLLRGLVFAPNPVTSVETKGNVIPEDFALHQNFPNPFNPSTKISFSLPISSDVRLSVINLLGQEIAVLKDENMSAGNHTVTWNSNTISNVSSGVYFFRIKAVGENGKEFNLTKKMMLLK